MPPSRLATERLRPLSQPSVKWWSPRESNPHAFRPRFLKPLCLPFHQGTAKWRMESRVERSRRRVPLAGFRIQCSRQSACPSVKWWWRRESNPGRRAFQTLALPLSYVTAVESAAGVEPALTGLQPAASPLRHADLKRGRQASARCLPTSGCSPGIRTQPARVKSPACYSADTSERRSGREPRSRTWTTRPPDEDAAVTSDPDEVV